jgi:hypothetical protein
MVSLGPDVSFVFLGELSKVEGQQLCLRLISRLQRLTWSSGGIGLLAVAELIFRTLCLAGIPGGVEL